MMSGVSPTSAVGDLIAQGSGAPAGAGADAQQAQLQQVAGQVRAIGDQIQQLISGNPMLAQDGQQISQILKGMIIKVAQAAPQQTMSGAAVPGAGGGG